MRADSNNIAELVIQGLSVSFGNKQALQDISFSVNAGECVGLIGPNGAGKTTLMRALLGFISTTTGDVSIKGQSLHHLSAAERAKLFAYLPQGGPVHWPMTVSSIVELGRMPHRHPWRKLSDTDNEAVSHAMIKTDVAQFAERIITSLSGGERARVMLARAIAVGAPFLLADEPAASLDPHYQLEMMALLKEQVSPERGVIIVMHDLNLAQQFCDRILVLSGGNMVADGVPSSVLTDSLLQDVFRINTVRWQDNDTAYIVPAPSKART